MLVPLKFEQIHATQYSHRPSDKVQELVDQLKPHLWVNVTSLPPYRKYYVYVSPGAPTSPCEPETSYLRTHLLPRLCYALPPAHVHANDERRIWRTAP